MANIELKISQSITLFRNLYSETKTNIVAFSGGKDSIVLKDIAERTRMKFKYIHSNTTIDAPGHLKWIKDNYSDVEIVNPKYSFYQMIAKYGLPTRHSRFCCQHLKEYVGKGCKVFEGLRIDEGFNRGKRLSLLKEPEMCDTRIKGKIHAYPIMQWNETEIWEYIDKYNLPYPDLYNKGFKRLGCIGCPLANKHQRINEYKMFPKYAFATVKAINKNIQAGRSLSKFFKDPYEAFHWWISEKSIKDYTGFQMFNFNFKQEIQDLLK